MIYPSVSERDLPSAEMIIDSSSSDVRTADRDYLRMKNEHKYVASRGSGRSFYDIHSRRRATECLKTGLPNAGPDEDHKIPADLIPKMWKYVVQNLSHLAPGERQEYNRIRINCRLSQSRYHQDSTERSGGHRNTIAFVIEDPDVSYDCKVTTELVTCFYCYVPYR